MTDDRTGPEHFTALHRHGFVRVAACTPAVRPADVSFNRDAILAEALRADAAGVDVAVFPELCVSSYAIDDLHLQTALLDAVEAAVGRILEATAALAPVLLIGAPLRHDGRLYNCALVLSRGRLLGVVPKSYLPNYREYYEKRWFAHGRGVAGASMRVAGREVPFGSDLIFAAEDLPGLILHVEICEDFWAATPPRPRARWPAPPSSPISPPPTSSSASRTSVTCSAAPSPRGRCRPTPIPPPGRARAPPTSPGTARA